MRANLMTTSNLYSFVKTLKYGKRLAQEALDLIYCDQETKHRKAAESLLKLFRECRQWSLFEWLSMKNYKRVHDGLVEVLFPAQFQKFKDRFKLRGFRCRSLCREMLQFIEQESVSWRTSDKHSASTRAEIRNCIDLLGMMIQDGKVDASLRQEWMKQLIGLCKKYRQIPKALELRGLKFGEDAAKYPFEHGGNADIMLAEMAGMTVVVKVLRPGKLTTNVMRKRLWSPLHEEALNWIGLDFPGVNPFFGITLELPTAKSESRSECRSPDLGIGLVFKFQELGNSVKYLAKNNIERVYFVEAKSFYLIGAIHYLHQMGLIHADIKGENILVDGNKDLVLTDFGLMLRESPQAPLGESSSGSASSSCSSPAASGENGTTRFSSKERVYTGKRSKEDDIWAIGMTLIQLLTGEPPFARAFEKDIWFTTALWHSSLKIRDAQLPDSLPPVLFKTIEKCTAPNPEDRPSTFELYSTMGQIAGSKALEGAMKEGYS